MNATDVIGYTTTGADMICARCADEAPDVEGLSGPVFPGSETDVPSHCLECGELIPETLTPDGRAYVAGKLAYHRETGYGVASVLEEWREAFGITDAEITGGD